MIKQLGTYENAKTIKGEEILGRNGRGHRTMIVYLAPASESGVMNTCPGSTAGCREGCLYDAGLASIFPNIKAARITKTRFLASDRTGFLEVLRADIRRLIRECTKHGRNPVVRINGTSDLPWIALTMASEFPTVQFYDYTKLQRPWERVRKNYHLTYSFSGENELQALEALQHGLNVSVVFDTRKGQPLPKTWNGYRVIDGDKHDLRFLDKKCVIVGLRAKGPAKKDELGFVVQTNLIQIAKTR